MHHKRTKTSCRKEIRRADNKSFRQQEDRAIERIDDRGPSLPRNDRWSYRPEPLPLGDVICTGRVNGNKKSRKPKAKLPKCSGHEWYEETVVEDKYVSHCTNEACRRYYCCGCFDERKGTWFTMKEWYTETRRQATCINCWKVRVYEKIDSRYPDGRYSWRGKKRRKIRTQDPVSGMTVAVR